MESLPTLLLATAYAPPISYFVKLYEHAGRVRLRAPSQREDRGYSDLLQSPCAPDVAGNMGRS